MSTVADLGIKMTADYAEMQKAFDQMRGDLTKVAASTQASSKSIESAMGKVPESLKQTQQELSKIGTLLSSGALIEGGKVLTDLVTVPLIGLGKEAVLMADKLRQTEIAFTTLLGSAEKSGAFLRELQAFAASTPFNFPDLTQSAKKMLALGFTAEQVIPMLTNVGNAVSGLGGNAQVFDRIILALGQMQAKGAVSAEEMKQLAEAGIPAWQALAGAIGVTVPEAMDMAKKKQIDSATAIAALQADMAQRFGGLMEQQAQTIQGTLANLHDTIGFIMTDIGREIIEALNIRDGLASVQEFAKDFLSWFKSLDQGTKQVLLVLTGAFALGGPILVAFGAFMAAVTVLTAPMLAGGAIVAGIIAGVTAIILNWQKIKSTGIEIWTTVKTTVVGTAKAIYEGIVEWLVTRASAVAQKLQTIASSFAKPFEWLADHLVGHSVIPDMVTRIQATMEQLRGPAMADVAREAAEKTAAHMEKLDANLSAPARRAAISIENAFRGIQLTTEDVLLDLRERTSYTAGAMIQSLSGAFAGAIQGTVNWAQVGQQMLSQLLTNSINMGLTWVAAWVIGEATRTTATTTANTVIAGSTAATATGMMAVMAFAGTAMKTVFLGLAHGVIAVLGVVVGAVSTVLDIVAMALSFIFETIATALYDVAIAALEIPFVGPFIAAALAALATGVSVLGLALPEIVGGISLGMGAAFGALAGSIPAFADGGIVFGPTLGLVGEAGPEVIAPLDSLGNLTGGGEHTTIIYLDGEVLARHMDKRIRRRVSLEGGFA